MSYLRYFILEALVKDPPIPSTVHVGAPPPLPPIPAAPELDFPGNTNAEDQRFIPTDSATGFRGQLLEGLRDAAGNIVTDLEGNRL
tara:strand:+ start:101 stop:358 length:258 start_codon:yes stop_codon:yes gene_type:complete